MTTAATQPSRKIRVLIADDSVFMRRSLERLLSGMPGIEVVGTAIDGVNAAQRALELRPDVITMDVEMPRMDGVRAVQEIMRSVPTPIVMVSTLTTQGSNTTIQALEAGAVECVAKPSAIAGELGTVAGQLAEAIHRASNAVLRKRSGLAAVPSRPTSLGSTSDRSAANPQVVVIGSSTGGPPALTEVIPHLPGDLPAPVLIVQHMPAGFTNALARRLDSLSALRVKEAEAGEEIREGVAYVAPGHFHMHLTSDRHIRLSEDPPVHGVRPSIDVTLESVLPVYGRNTQLTILTGMGKDGADAAADVEAAGGDVIVQDEATCVVYGMPKAARERTTRSLQVPLESVAAAITRSIYFHGVRS